MECIYGRGQLDWLAGFAGQYVKLERRAGLGLAAYTSSIARGILVLFLKRIFQSP